MFSSKIYRAKFNQKNWRKQNSLTRQPTLMDQGYDQSKIIQMVLQHKRALWGANLMAMIAVLASIPVPLMLPLLVDEVLLEKPGALIAMIQVMFPADWHGAVLYIGAVAVVTIILRCIALLFNVWQTRAFTLIAKGITFRIRRDLLKQLKKIAMAEYETMGSGAVTSHFVTDINALDEFIGITVSRFLVALLSIFGVTAVLLWMHWPLAIFVLLVNPIIIYFTIILGKKVKQLKQQENSAFEIFQQALTEMLDNIQQIRISHREQHYISQVMQTAHDIKRHSAELTWRSDAANRFSFAIFLFGFDMFRAVSMLMVVFSDLSIGEMMAIFGYLWFMMTPVEEVLKVQYAYFAAQAALIRINKIFALKTELRYPSVINPFIGKSTVSVAARDISFAYSATHPAIIQNLSLDIQAGEKVALVGASGGGKSTLVQLLLGMYRPNQGEIFFDNIPVTQIGFDVIRHHVATVLQQPALFNDSVRNNLSMGLNHSDDALLEALVIAQLKETILGLSHGLETIIGHHGIRLSGGQKQRLAIARMILSHPSVVILDEATSALDTDTEARLHQALQHFLQGKTTLIIAHRLSSIKQADRVLVFDEGRIIEQGTHEQLLQNKGLYHQLYGHR